MTRKIAKAETKTGEAIPVEGSRPSIEEYYLSIRSSRCAVCSQPAEVREMVDQGLRSGIGAVRIARYLREVHGVTLSEHKVDYHRSGRHFESAK